jgi:hypothetical protein
MPRTRGLGVLHMDAGEALGRGGEPLPTLRREPPPSPQVEFPPVPAVQAPSPPAPTDQELRTVFELTPDLWPRSWDGWHFLHVANAFFVKCYGVELSATFTADEYRALHPDIQQHCQRRRVA